MPIITISRWQISFDDASRIARDVAPLLKQQGATQVHLGRILTGEDAGQITIAVRYPDGETFGRALQQQQTDQQYQRSYQEALQKGQLRNRTVVQVEDIG